MTLAYAVTVVAVNIVLDRGPIATFDALVQAVRAIHVDASVTDIDVAARPYEVGRPGAYRYERVDGPGHCNEVDAGATGGR